jgi:hypothetical protein
VVGLGFAVEAFSVRTSLLGFSIALAVVIGLVSRRLLAQRPGGGGLADVTAARRGRG